MLCMELYSSHQDHLVVVANLWLRLALESPLLVQAWRIALGDHMPVVLAAKVGSASASDRYCTSVVLSPWARASRASITPTLTPSESAPGLGASCAVFLAKCALNF
jgi:hypothetical protein